MLFFIVNEKSRVGRAGKTWVTISKFLKKQEIEYKAYKTEYDGHAKELASLICKKTEGTINLVVVGGDGTINEVINGITDFDRVRMGVIPNGSGNDFCRGLRLSGSVNERIEKIVEAASSENEELLCMDLGRVTYNGKNRIFGISSGIGLDALVCKKAFTSRIKKWLNKIHLGNLTYIAITVKSLFTMDTVQCEVILDDEEPVVRKRMIYAAAMNLETEGGGVRMAPGKRPDDSELTMCMAYGISKRKAFLCLPLLVFGWQEKIKGFEVIPFSKCKIISRSPQVLHTDGEYCGEWSQVEFDCLKQKLRILKKEV